MTTDQTGTEVRSLLDRERSGTLCTLSRKVAGWPFGSITPFALSGKGEPIILISEIAEHTRNLHNDARVSLLVQDSGMSADPQAGARVTLMGYGVPVPRSCLDDARTRYISLFPDSASYFDVHEFSLFQIRVRHVRFIGGFGEIYWLTGDDVTALTSPTVASSAGDPLTTHVESICRHMNEDHADALRSYAAAFGKTEAESAEMIHVEACGFDIMAISEGRHRHIRLEFPTPVSSVNEVRSIMIEMLQAAKRMILS